MTEIGGTLIKHNIYFELKHKLLNFKNDNLELS